MVVEDLAAIIHWFYQFMSLLHQQMRQWAQKLLYSFSGTDLTLNFMQIQNSKIFVSIQQSQKLAAMQNAINAVRDALQHRPTNLILQRARIVAEGETKGSNQNGRIDKTAHCSCDGEGCSRGNVFVQKFKKNHSNKNRCTGLHITASQ